MTVRGDAGRHRRRDAAGGPDARVAPGGVRRRPASFHERLARRLEPRPDAGDLPQLVRISLRVEADEEELVAGSVRLVLQVHDEQDPLHLCDAAVLWTESGAGASHGFGDRARTHAAIALRAAAEAWPVLDRLAELRVPDQITLDTDELVSLLNARRRGPRRRAASTCSGRAAWAETSPPPRCSSRAPAAPPTTPLQTGLFGADQMFSFQWQVALHGEALTEEEMARLARSAAPILRLRGNWTVIDPAVARKARKRLIRTVAPGPAVAAALTGTVEVGQGDDAVDEQVVVGATLLDVRERLLGAATRDPIEPPAGLAGTLRDYQRQGLTWLVEMTSLGLGACLADDMGLGKTITLIALHLHRCDHGPGGPTLVVCPASLLGNWEAEIARFAPGRPVRRFHGGGRSLADVRDGFVLTTYGTMRVSAEALAEVRWGLVVADEAQHVKNARSSTARALRSIPHGARIAMTGTPGGEQPHRALGDPRLGDPGAAGQPARVPQAWAAQVEAGVDPAVTRQFTELISPFVLRRRKSDPGIAPELPAKTETDHPLGLTREQVVLYEAFVKDTMERIERADPADQATRRGLVLALLTGLKQICNHPAHFLKQSGAVRLTGRSEKLDLIDELLGTVLAEDGAALVFTQYVEMGRLLSAHLSKSGVEHRFLHGGTPDPGARVDGGGVPGRRLPGLPALAQGGRHRAQPDQRRPRHPRRPLVEPGRRGAGHRPGLPDRPDQARPGAPPHHQGHDRGEDRRAARPQAGPGRLRARQRRGRAHRAQRRRAARPGDPAAATRTAGTAGTGESVRTVVHPRVAPRSTSARASSWWGKAWVRAVEEASYSSADLLVGRRMSRAGQVGQIMVEPGRFVASVEDARGLWTVAGTVPELDESASEAFVETVAAEAGRVGALLSGDLPHTHGRARRGGRRRAAALRRRARAPSAPAEAGPSPARTRWPCSTS